MANRSWPLLSLSSLLSPLSSLLSTLSSPVPPPLSLRFFGARPMHHPTSPFSLPAIAGTPSQSSSGAPAIDGFSGGSPSVKRKVMVVVDPGRESTVALDWALYHAVLEHDEIILLHIDPPVSTRRASSLSSLLRRPPSLTSVMSAGSNSGGGSSHGSSAGEGAGGSGGEFEFLEAMKAKCATAQPNVKMQIERVTESKNKAATILTQTMTLGIDLLVIGQRRSSAFSRYKFSSGNSSKGLDTAEFLIENCKCLCIGVQKKGQNAGYLLNTKTHKNFWILA